MCGRYLRRSDKQRIAEAFRLLQDLSAIPLPPDYNIAPTTFQPVIRLHRETGARELVLMRWGLVPHHARSLADSRSLFTINARAETLTTNPLWRRPFERHRCLVPADGFYEWKKAPAAPDVAAPDVAAPGVAPPDVDLPAQPSPPAPGPAARTPPGRSRSPGPSPKSEVRTKPTLRQPFLFTVSAATPATPPLRPDSPPEQPFAFAGLWDAWRDPANGLWLQSFAIITTDANELMAPVHNRMPVILEPRDYDRWLSRSPGHQPPTDLLRPLDPTHMRRQLANPAVGNVRNNHPDLLAPPGSPPINSA